MSRLHSASVFFFFLFVFWGVCCYEANHPKKKTFGLCGGYLLLCPGRGSMQSLSEAGVAAVPSVAAVPGVIAGDEPTPLQTLRHELGLQHFKPGQLEVITSILHGGDTMVFFATGVGKSICYQLPAVHRRRLVFIVSPLLSLIEDQIKNVNERFGRELGVSFASTNATPQIREKLESGESLLCYCTPERLSTSSFLDHVEHLHTNVREVMLLAVDEAHMILQQGVCCCSVCSCALAYRE